MRIVRHFPGADGKETITLAPTAGEMMSQAFRQTENLILLKIADADFHRIEGDLKKVDLPLQKMLERRSRRIENVYFPDSGFASVVAGGDKPIEVGIIGREGMTGLPVVLGEDRAENETYIQVAGRGSQLSRTALQEAMNESRPLHLVMLRYANAFLNQTARTAKANGSAKIEARLARWLLLAADRIEGALPLTHEFIAIMLGVRRPGVTLAIQALEHKKLISRARGATTILDRAGLQKLCHDIYTPPK